MNCKAFKEKHVAFVDDTLAGVELVELQQHMADCPECARRDTLVRRALLLVRNLPAVELSPDFAARLETKLAECRAAPTGVRLIKRRIAVTTMLAAAAMIGYIAVTLYEVEIPRDMRLAPVVASAPESDLAPMASPVATIVAAAPSGLAVWPAALLAEQAPVRFAHARFASASLTR